MCEIACPLRGEFRCAPFVLDYGEILRSCSRMRKRKSRESNSEFYFQLRKAKTVSTILRTMWVHVDGTLDEVEEKAAVRELRKKYENRYQRVMKGKKEHKGTVRFTIVREQDKKMLRRVKEEGGAS